MLGKGPADSSGTMQKRLWHSKTAYSLQQADSCCSGEESYRNIKLGVADLKAGRNMQTKKKTPAMAKQCLGRFLMPAHHDNAWLCVSNTVSG